jgi:transposase InsO family protein
MPWEERRPMELRKAMIVDLMENNYRIAELSRKYKVSRKTVYKWIKRFGHAGDEGLKERSRAPKYHPNQTSSEVTELIVTMRIKHRDWGPKKIHQRMGRIYPGIRVPAKSTIGKILKQQGLIGPKRRKLRTPPYLAPLSESLAPNDVWTADFKGQFRTGDGKLCYPLTIVDDCSRYILLCKALEHPAHDEVRPWFERVFCTYGIPKAIRTDNGPPFASHSLGGLSRLAVWFMKLGIKTERIQIGHPEQNGRHERMHRSLKEAACKPPKANLLLQQQAFDTFMEEYNQQRPHEALGMQTPADIYEPSSIPFPSIPTKFTYPVDGIVRSVRSNGEIRWNKGKLFISENLYHERILLMPIDNQTYEIWFRSTFIGLLDKISNQVFSSIDSKPRRGLSPISPV